MNNRPTAEKPVSFKAAKIQIGTIAFFVYNW